jgi:DNA-directed RNA polymerase subunit RPC12/RpoP
MPAKKKAAAKKATSRKPAAPAKKKAPSKPSEDLVAVYCSRCGTTGQTVRGGVPLSWSVGFGGGRLEYICAACARTNIRAIEGKLPEEWWE